MVTDRLLRDAGINTDSTDQTDQASELSSTGYFFVESSIFSSFVPGCWAPGDKIPVPAKAEVTHGNSNRDQEALPAAKSGL